MTPTVGPRSRITGVGPYRDRKRSRVPRRFSSRSRAETRIHCPLQLLFTLPPIFEHTHIAGRPRGPHSSSSLLLASRILRPQGPCQRALTNLRARIAFASLCDAHEQGTGRESRQPQQLETGKKVAILTTPSSSDPMDLLGGNALSANPSVLYAFVHRGESAEIKRGQKRTVRIGTIRPRTNHRRKTQSAQECAKFETNGAERLNLGWAKSPTRTFSEGANWFSAFRVTVLLR